MVSEARGSSGLLGDNRASKLVAYVSFQNLSLPNQPSQKRNCITKDLTQLTSPAESMPCIRPRASSMRLCVTGSATLLPAL